MYFAPGVTPGHSKSATLHTNGMRLRTLSLIRIGNLSIVAWSLLTILLLVLAFDSFIGRHIGDSSIYLYVGKGILEGEMPYVDRWDNKGPLFYLLNAVGFLVHETWGAWLVQGLFLLAASAFAFLVFRRGFGTVPAFCALALFLVFYGKFSPPGNYTEQYAFLFQFLSLYLFLHSQAETDDTPAHVRFALLHLGIGVLGAATFLIRPNLVVLWLVIGLYWLVLRGASMRKLAWAVLGGGSVLLLVGAYFTAVGAMAALWSAVFGYNFAHSTVTFNERISVLIHLASAMFPVTLVVIAAWGIGIAVLVRNRTLPHPTKGLLSLALISLPLELVSLSLSGFVFAHYYLTALPAAMLLLAFLVWLVIERIPGPQSLLTLVLVSGTAFYSLSDIHIERLNKKYVTEGVFVENSETRLAKRIREVTEPEDYILAWGKGANLHLLSDRDAPTRYFFHHPLTKPHYTTHAMRAEFLSDLKEHLPVLIIDTHFHWFPPLEREARKSWEPYERHMHDLQDFEPFFEFVESNYLPVEEFPPFTVYALITDVVISPATVPGQLIIRSTYDVYLNDRTLTFVKSRCTQHDALKRFIVHVIPVDNNVIDGRAQATRDFNFLEGKTWQIGAACLVSVDLPDYPIASIRVGQYNLTRTGHDWLSEYHLQELD